MKYLVFLLLLVVGLVLVAPQVVSTTLLQPVIEKAFDQKMHYSALKLSWFGDQRIEEVEWKQEGQQIEADRVVVHIPL
ncbi:MAG: hypothetical protein KDK65_08085, partial [Chlamydiia bacterium]|nr:hypothetical protein [Chlamydiia bacterium]